MDNNVQIDTLSVRNGALQGSGDVAMRLLQSNFNVNALRTSEVLRKDEWITMDNILVEVARRRLGGVNALISRGLRYNVAEAMGTTQIQWENVSDMTPADVSMSGLSEAERDRLMFELKTMPLPIIHKDFQINLRNLMSSRRTGQSLDMAQMQLASRLVVEQIESILFNGLSLNVGGSTIPGLLTEENRNQVDISDWENVATTGATKVAEVIEMVSALVDDNMYGPYGIFVTQAAYNLLAEDYKADSDKTQLARLLEIPNIDFILPTKDMAASTVSVVQLTSDVVEEVVGLQPTVVQWESHGGMMQHFKVMAIMLPRVRSTYDNQSGVVYAHPDVA